MYNVRAHCTLYRASAILTARRLNFRRASHREALEFKFSGTGHWAWVTGNTQRVSGGEFFDKYDWVH